MVIGGYQWLRVFFVDEGWLRGGYGWFWDGYEWFWAGYERLWVVLGGNEGLWVGYWWL